MHDGPTATGLAPRIGSSVALILVAFFSSATSADERVERWQADLQQLATDLPKLHINAFFKTKQSEFLADIKALERKLGELADHQVEAGLMRIVARLGDGHTAVVPHFQRMRIVPLRFRWFKDGVFAVSCSADYEQALGGKLLKVGELSLEEVLKRFRQLLSHDNESAFKNLFGNYFSLAELVHACGAWDSPRSGTFTLLKDGKEFKLDVRSVTRKQAAGFQTRLSARKKLPLYARKSNLPYWNDWLAPSKTVFFKYNRCQNFNGFSKLVLGTIGFIKQNDVQRFVLDLRDNGGGNSLIFTPLFSYLLTNQELNRKGKLFVIIGRRTFSSAVLNAMSMKKTKAIFVGEPTGGRPNHYGEVRSFKLRNSGLQVRYSTQKFVRIKDADPDSLVPDVVVEPTYADWKAGRDPVLEKILKMAQ